MEEQLPSLGVQVCCVFFFFAAPPSAGNLRGRSSAEVYAGEWAVGGGIAARKATGAAFKCAAVFSTASHERVDMGLFILRRFCS